LRLGVPDVFSDIGYPEDLYERYRISKDGIPGGVKEVIAKS
jgi:transketolase C-terminal domain/subunit